MLNDVKVNDDKLYKRFKKTNKQTDAHSLCIILWIYLLMHWEREVRINK